MGKAIGLYLLLVYLFAYIVVMVVVRGATGVNIDDRHVECSAQPWARTAVILSMTVVAALIHVVISYFYVQSNGEGPYGPLPRPRSRKTPKRTRFLPYVSNATLLAFLIPPAIFLIVPSSC